jgi:hypothetical protein
VGKPKVFRHHSTSYQGTASWEAQPVLRLKGSQCKGLRAVALQHAKMATVINPLVLTKVPARSAPRYFDAIFHRP